MKKNRIFAMMTALCCAAGMCAAMPSWAAASGEETTLPVNTFAVTGMEGEYYTLIDLSDGMPYSFSLTQYRNYGGEGLPVLGDILAMDGYMAATVLWGMNEFWLYKDEMSGELADSNARITGSLLDNECLVRKTKTVTSKDSAGFVWFGNDTPYYRKSALLNTVDWTAVQDGEQLDFYYYGDVPVFTSFDTEHFFGSVVMLIAEADGLFYCSNGCVLGENTFANYRTGGDAQLECGDLLLLGGYTIDPIEPGQFAFDETGFILNLGDVTSYYSDRCQMTVTAKEGHSFITYTLEDAAGTVYTFETFQPDAVEKYSFTQTMGHEDLVVGESYTFVQNPAGDVLVPLLEEKRATQFVVIGVDEPTDPQKLLLMNPDTNLTYEMRYRGMFFDGEETPQYGDILHFYGAFAATEKIGTNDMSFYDENNVYLTETNGEIGFRIVGSVYDTPTTQTFTAGRVWEWVDHWYSFDGTYNYYTDYLTAYTQPSGIDWTTVKSSDRVTFYTYKGVPMLPTAVAYAGDVNSDNAVTIADVIFLNRQILGDVTAKSTFNQTLADFDANGIIDAADSLMILKRIVELI